MTRRRTGTNRKRPWNFFFESKSKQWKQYEKRMLHPSKKISLQMLQKQQFTALVQYMMILENVNNNQNDNNTGSDGASTPGTSAATSTASEGQQWKATNFLNFFTRAFTNELEGSVGMGSSDFEASNTQRTSSDTQKQEKNNSTWSSLQKKQNKLRDNDNVLDQNNLKDSDEKHHVAEAKEANEDAKKNLLEGGNVNKSPTDLIPDIELRSAEESMGKTAEIGRDNQHQTCETPSSTEAVESQFYKINQKPTAKKPQVRRKTHINNPYVSSKKTKPNMASFKEYIRLAGLNMKQDHGTTIEGNDYGSSYGHVLDSTQQDNFPDYTDKDEQFKQPDSTQKQGDESSFKSMFDQPTDNDTAEIQPPVIGFGIPTDSPESPVPLMASGTEIFFDTNESSIGILSDFVSNNRFQHPRDVTRKQSWTDQQTQSSEMSSGLGAKKPLFFSYHSKNKNKDLTKRKEKEQHKIQIKDGNPYISSEKMSPNRMSFKQYLLSQRSQEKRKLSPSIDGDEDAVITSFMDNTKSNQSHSIIEKQDISSCTNSNRQTTENEMSPVKEIQPPKPDSSSCIEATQSPNPLETLTLEEVFATEETFDEICSKLIENRFKSPEDVEETKTRTQTNEKHEQPNSFSYLHKNKDKNHTNKKEQGQSKMQMKDRNPYISSEKKLPNMTSFKQYLLTARSQEKQELNPSIDENGEAVLINVLDNAKSNQSDSITDPFKEQKESVLSPAQDIQPSGAGTNIGIKLTESPDPSTGLKMEDLFTTEEQFDEIFSELINNRFKSAKDVAETKTWTQTSEKSSGLTHEKTSLFSYLHKNKDKNHTNKKEQGQSKMQMKDRNPYVSSEKKLPNMMSFKQYLLTARSQEPPGIGSKISIESTESHNPSIKSEMEGLIATKNQFDEICSEIINNRFKSPEDQETKTWTKTSEYSSGLKQEKTYLRNKDENHTNKKEQGQSKMQIKYRSPYISSEKKLPKMMSFKQYLLTTRSHEKQELNPSIDENGEAVLINVLDNAKSNQSDSITDPFKEQKESVLSPAQDIQPSGAGTNIGIKLTESPDPSTGLKMEDLFTTEEQFDEICSELNKNKFKSAKDVAETKTWRQTSEKSSGLTHEKTSLFSYLHKNKDKNHTNKKEQGQSKMQMKDRNPYVSSEKKLPNMMSFKQYLLTTRSQEPPGIGSKISIESTESPNPSIESEMEGLIATKNQFDEICSEIINNRFKSPEDQETKTWTKTSEISSGLKQEKTYLLRNKDENHTNKKEQGQSKMQIKYRSPYISSEKKLPNMTSFKQYLLTARSQEKQELNPSIDENGEAVLINVLDNAKSNQSDSIIDPFKEQKESVLSPAQDIQPSGAGTNIGIKLTESPNPSTELKMEDLFTTEEQFDEICSELKKNRSKYAEDLAETKTWMDQEQTRTSEMSNGLKHEKTSLFSYLHINKDKNHTNKKEQGQSKMQMKDRNPYVSSEKKLPNMMSFKQYLLTARSQEKQELNPSIDENGDAVLINLLDNAKSNQSDSHLKHDRPHKNPFDYLTGSISHHEQDKLSCDPEPNVFTETSRSSSLQTPLKTEETLPSGHNFNRFLSKYQEKKQNAKKSVKSTYLHTLRNSKPAHKNKRQKKNTCLRNLRGIEAFIAKQQLLTKNDDIVKNQIPPNAIFGGENTYMIENSKPLEISNSKIFDDPEVRHEHQSINAKIRNTQLSPLPNMHEMDNTPTIYNALLSKFLEDQKGGKKPGISSKQKCYQKMNSSKYRRVKIISTKYPNVKRTSFLQKKNIGKLKGFYQKEDYLKKGSKFSSRKADIDESQCSTYLSFINNRSHEGNDLLLNKIGGLLAGSGVQPRHHELNVNPDSNDQQSNYFKEELKDTIDKEIQPPDNSALFPFKKDSGNMSSLNRQLNGLLSIYMSRQKKSDKSSGLKGLKGNNTGFNNPERLSARRAVCQKGIISNYLKYLSSTPNILTKENKVENKVKIDFVAKNGNNMIEKQTPVNETFSAKSKPSDKEYKADDTYDYQLSTQSTVMNDPWVNSKKERDVLDKRNMNTLLASGLKNLKTKSKSLNKHDRKISHPKNPYVTIEPSRNMSFLHSTRNSHEKLPYLKTNNRNSSKLDDLSMQEINFDQISQDYFAFAFQTPAGNEYDNPTEGRSPTITPLVYERYKTQKPSNLAQLILHQRLKHTMKKTRDKNSSGSNTKAKLPITCSSFKVVQEFLSRKGKATVDCKFLQMINGIQNQEDSIDHLDFPYDHTLVSSSSFLGQHHSSLITSSFGKSLPGKNRIQKDGKPKSGYDGMQSLKASRNRSPSLEIGKKNERKNENIVFTTKDALIGKQKGSFANHKYIHQGQQQSLKSGTRSKPGDKIREHIRPSVRGASHSFQNNHGKFASRKDLSPKPSSPSYYSNGRSTVKSKGLFLPVGSKQKFINQTNSPISKPSKESMLRPTIFKEMPSKEKDTEILSPSFDVNVELYHTTPEKEEIPYRSPWYLKQDNDASIVEQNERSSPDDSTRSDNSDTRNAVTNIETSATAHAASKRNTSSDVIIGSTKIETPEGSTLLKPLESLVNYLLQWKKKNDEHPFLQVEHLNVSERSVSSLYQYAESEINKGLESASPTPTSFSCSRSNILLGDDDERIYSYTDEKCDVLKSVSPSPTQTISQAFPADLARDQPFSPIETTTESSDVSLMKQPTISLQNEDTHSMVYLSQISDIYKASTSGSEEQTIMISPPRLHPNINTELITDLEMPCTGSPAINLTPITFVSQQVTQPTNLDIQTPSRSTDSPKPLIQEPIHIKSPIETLKSFTESITQILISATSQSPTKHSHSNKESMAQIHEHVTETPDVCLQQLVANSPNENLQQAPESPPNEYPNTDSMQTMFSQSMSQSPNKSISSPSESTTAYLSMDETSLVKSTPAYVSMDETSLVKSTPAYVSMDETSLVKSTTACVSMDETSLKSTTEESKSSDESSVKSPCSGTDFAPNDLQLDSDSYPLRIPQPLDKSPNEDQQSLCISPSREKGTEEDHSTVMSPSKYQRSAAVFPKSGRQRMTLSTITEEQVVSTTPISELSIESMSPNRTPNTKPSFIKRYQPDDMIQTNDHVTALLSASDHQAASPSGYQRSLLSPLKSVHQQKVPSPGSDVKEENEKYFSPYLIHDDSKFTALSLEGKMSPSVSKIMASDSSQSTDQNKSSFLSLLLSYRTEGNELPCDPSKPTIGRAVPSGYVQHKSLFFSGGDATTTEKPSNDQYADQRECPETISHDSLNRTSCERKTSIYDRMTSMDTYQYANYWKDKSFENTETVSDSCINKRSDEGMSDHAQGIQYLTYFEDMKSSVNRLGSQITWEPEDLEIIGQSPFQREQLYKTESSDYWAQDLESAEQFVNGKRPEENLQTTSSAPVLGATKTRSKLINKRRQKSVCPTKSPGNREISPYPWLNAFKRKCKTRNSISDQNITLKNKSSNKISRRKAHAPHRGDKTYNKCLNVADGDDAREFTKPMPPAKTKRLRQRELQPYYTLADKALKLERKISKNLRREVMFEDFFPEPVELCESIEK